MDILIAERAGDAGSIAELFNKQKGLLSGELTIDTAASGEQTLSKLKENAPELLLLDLVLSGDDGFTVLKEMYKDARCSHTRVMVCSALCSPEAVAKAFELGAIAFFPKPFEQTLTACELLRLFSAITNGCIFINNIACDRAQVLRETTALLNELGIPPQLSGCEYLRFCIMLALESPSARVFSGLYPAAAQKYGSTAARVERSIRQAIESAWNKGSLAALNKYFGYSVDAERGRPTNAEFLARAKDALTLKLTS